MIDPKYLIYLTGAYIALFMLYTFIRTAFPKSEKYIFCSTCLAYFTVLIAGIFLKFDIAVIGLLIGMSITGIAYSAQNYLMKKETAFFGSHFVIQLALTIAGIGLLILLS